MFIDVAQEAFGTIATWQFWSVVVVSSFVIILGFGLLSLPMVLPGISRVLAFVSMPVMFFLPSITVTVGIILLIPVMIFRTDGFGWDYIYYFGVVDLLKIAGAGFLGTLVAAFLPIIGRAESTMALAQAAVVLSLSIRWLSNGAINVRPDFWTAVVMLLSIGIAMWAFTLLVALVSMAVFGSRAESAKLVSLVLGSFLSYLAAAVYAGWVSVENFG